MVKVSDGIVAIVYEDGTGADGILITVDIDSAGDIGSIIDTLEFESGAIEDPVITLAREGIVAILYPESSSADGHIVTVAIDSTGDIVGDAIIDEIDGFQTAGESHTHDTYGVLSIAEGVVAVVYEQFDPEGTVTTFEIDSDGMITKIDLLEITTPSGTPHDPEIACVTSDIVAIAYEASGDEGVIITVGIEGTVCAFRTSGGGGSDASEYLSKPTFGLDHKTGIVQVQGGFTANGKVFDVTDNWHTDFEKTSCSSWPDQHILC